MKLYRNKRNHNKFLYVKHYPCGHWYIQQFMEWPNGVRNYTGTARNRPRFRRVTKRTLVDILTDYERGDEYDTNR